MGLYIMILVFAVVISAGDGNDGAMCSTGKNVDHEWLYRLTSPSCGPKAKTIVSGAFWYRRERWDPTRRTCAGKWSLRAFGYFQFDLSECVVTS